MFDAQPWRNTRVWTIDMETRLREGGGVFVASDGNGPVSQDMLADLYWAHYPALIRLAALLLDEPAAREDVVQEAFVRVAASVTRPRDPGALLAYLQRTVVNLSRSAMRRRLVRRRRTPWEVGSAAPADEAVLDALLREELITALRGLPRRQREVIVLRYFAEMTEEQAAHTLHLSVGSVKAYASRGVAGLASALGARP